MDDATRRLGLWKFLAHCLRELWLIIVLMIAVLTFVVSLQTAVALALSGALFSSIILWTYFRIRLLKERNS